MKPRGILLAAFAGGAVCTVLGGCLQAVGDLGGARDATLNRPRGGGFLTAPAVEGLQYVSRDVTGETGANGSYVYEVGENIVFSLGGVTVASINGRGLVTARDLVPNGTIANTTVLNITRFLMMLDDNGDPLDGIRISPAVREIASTWEQVDFSTGDLDAELVDIISSAASVDGIPHALPDAATAQAHLQTALTCLYSGGFQGQIGNGDVGRLGFIVNPVSAAVEGYVQGTQTPTPPLRRVIGLNALDFTQSQLSLLASDQTGVQYTVQFNSVNQIGGNWTNPANPGQPGTLAGGRVTPAALNVDYRFAGAYTGDDTGIFVLDVPLEGRVLGRMYSVTRDFTLTLNGTLENENTLAITGEDGSTLFNGVINWDTFQLTGDWGNEFADPPLRGDYSGAGCPLL